MSKPKTLPAPLRALVGTVQAALGDAVRDAEGDALYDAIESVRRDMVTFRDSRHPQGKSAALKRAAKRLRAMAPGAQLQLARAYTLYLQLANICENAYRTHRLRERGREPFDKSWIEAKADARPRANLVLVLTAHPTESRSPENIHILRRVQQHLVAGLDEQRPPDPVFLRHALLQAWRIGTHPRHKPTVEDEARHLVSLLTDPILDELLDLRRHGHLVRFRTWVGGDKDGHPGVGPEQTAASLDVTRARLLAFVRARILRQVQDDVALQPREALQRALARIAEATTHLEHVAHGDGGRVAALRRAVTQFQSRYRRAVGCDHPKLARLALLLDMFPALVVPLELREERGSFGQRSPIASMMRHLREVAAGGRVADYVRGCVVSMTSAPRDLLEAADLVASVFGAAEAVPVIPLFELPEVLARSEEILRETWTHRRFREGVRRRGLFEVMVGYSDTAKRMGMLSSRVAIHRALRAIGAWASAEDVQVLFFHGSGGSVGRGGGTIQEQAATWPAGAVALIKRTVQGEMVERTLCSPEILRSLVTQTAAVQANPPTYTSCGELASRLSDLAAKAFAELVANVELRDLLDAATPYSRLDSLTIGSRPVRRAKKKRGAAKPDGAPLESLRAIPWVLCWTQTRFLLNAWFGVGSAWRALRKEPGMAIQLERALESDPLLRSYLRLLGFTLSKAAPRLWRQYVRELAPNAPKALLGRLEREWEAAVDLVQRASSDGTLLPDRPWLEESIRYRAPMIHPLNLLQIDVLQKPRLTKRAEDLFRETVTGIAAGMLTTG